MTKHGTENRHLISDDGTIERFSNQKRAAVNTTTPDAVVEAFKQSGLDPKLFPQQTRAEPKGPPATAEEIAEARKRMAMNDLTYKMVSGILSGEISAEEIEEIPDEDQD